MKDLNIEADSHMRFVKSIKKATEATISFISAHEKMMLYVKRLYFIRLP